MSLSFLGITQKVVKMYFGNHLLSLDHQVDPKTGVDNGYYKKYDYDGKLTLEGFYKMGKRNGVWKQYNQYGKVVYLSTFQNDILNGLYKEWDENGTHLVKSYVYKNGEVIKQTTYWPNGVIRRYADKDTTINYSNKGVSNLTIINGKYYITIVR